MRSLLADWFSVDEVYERPFVCWRTLNWVGRMAAAAKMGLYYLGRHGSSENVVFRASKTRPHQAILAQRHCADPVNV
jgi:hypothetical protein